MGVPGRLRHAEYLGHWLQVLRNDKRAIFTAASAAQRASEYLLTKGETDTQEAREPRAGIVPDRFAHATPVDLSDVEHASVVRLALASLAARHQAGVMLSSPNAVRDYLQLQLGERRNEVFGVLFLDNRNRVIRFEELFYGTIDGTSVHSRVVVQRALELNAAAVILCHNHPSGVAEPSQADEALTRRLKDTLSLIDVRVLDHFVVAAGEVVSFAERGLL